MKFFSRHQLVICGVVLISSIAFGLLAPVLPVHAQSTNNPGAPGQAVSIQGTKTAEDDDPVFSKVYAHVNTTGSKVSVYATPEDAVNNINSVRELNGYEWVTVMNSVELSGTTFSQIKVNEWVRSDRLDIFRP